MINPCKAKAATAVSRKHQQQNHKRIEGDEEIVVNPGKRRKQNTECFPKHLVDDMLLNLSVKSLLRFRSLSKHYNSLICSSSFIRAHLHYNRNNLSTGSLFIQKNSTTIAMLHYNTIQAVEEEHLDELTILEAIPRDVTFPYVEPYEFEINGCCDGMICIVSSCETSIGL